LTKPETPAGGRTRNQVRGRVEGRRRSTLKLSGRLSATLGDGNPPRSRIGVQMSSQFARLLAACWLGCDPCRVLELFSDRARQVVVEASETARTLGHGFIGAEHLLLGVIAEKHGAGATVLKSLGVTDEAVRRELLVRHPQGDRPSEGALPLNEEGKSALERSLVEAENFGDSQIQTAQVLLR
jgi:hypothetical protein